MPGLPWHNLEVRLLFVYPAAKYLSFTGQDGEGQMKHFVNDDGFNTFRLPVGWQFLTNGVLGGTLDETNFAQYDTLVKVVTAPSILPPDFNCPGRHA